MDSRATRTARGTLPHEFDASDLPASLFDALAAGVAALPADARELACALALSPEQIAAMAKRYAQWAPVLRYATAEYHRMTRDYERARGELESLLASVDAGTHQIWAQAANAHAQVLLDLGRAEQAQSHAEDYAARAEHDLGYLPDALLLSRSLARAAAGDSQAAAPVDALLAPMHEQQAAYLHVGAAHGVRARIALRQHDTTEFARHAELCRIHFFKHANSALTAKYHRLFQEGRRKLSFTPEPAPATSAAAIGVTRIELALARCRDDDQRARLALTLLTRQIGANAGCLFMLGEREPVCAARGQRARSSRIPRAARVLSGSASCGERSHVHSK